MKTLTVDLGDRGYPIYIGKHLLQTTNLLTKHIQTTKVLVVTNTTVRPLYAEVLSTLLANTESDVLELADGEQYKNWESLNAIYTHLLTHNYGRDCTLIALGGGVVGDVTGFAAASYQRGVNYIQIPTTLLAQVDSSVGGKTAINHTLGKNMVGAFYQPSCVIADISTLESLPERELIAGLAEVLKYGLIQDKNFFNWLENNIDNALQREESALIEIIGRSCSNKAAIVNADEKERGVRALLNLGHTFGHAIETYVAYQGWLHGEAVGCGILMAAEFSAYIGLLSNENVKRIRKTLEHIGLPVQPPTSISVEEYIRLMRRDKKNQDGKIRLVLLRDIGDAFVTDDYSLDALQEYLAKKLLSAT